MNPLHRLFIIDLFMYMNMQGVFHSFSNTHYTVSRKFSLNDEHEATGILLQVPIDVYNKAKELIESIELSYPIEEVEMEISKFA